MKESIKCNHNDIANYIQNNYLVNEDTKAEEESKFEVVNGLKYFNFEFVKTEQINEKTLENKNF